MSNRILDYPEATEITSNDYILLDNEGTGAKCIKASALNINMDNYTIKEASEAIASFEDGEDLPLAFMGAYITAIQDLHGYDYPWVGGAGKNKFNPNINDWVTSTYRYFKIPNFTDSIYVMSVVDNDTSVDVTDVNVGFMNNYPDDATEYRWVIVNGVVQSNMTNVSGRSQVNCNTIIIYPNSENAFNRLFQRYKIQVEKGTTATAYAPYENICPISGWSAVDVSVVGKNLVESTLANTTINTNGEINVSGGSSTFDMHIAKIIKGETYTIQSDESQNVNQKFVGGFFYDMPQLGSISYNNSRLANTPATFTAPIDGYVAFRTSHNYAFAQIEFGSTATTYEPYNGHTYTIDLDGTRYGGKLDVVSGVLTVDRIYKQVKDFDWRTQSGYYGRFFTVPSGADKALSDTYKPLIISDTYKGYSDADKPANANGVYIGSGGSIKVWDSEYTEETDIDAWKTARANVELCYYLATPLTIQLTPQMIYSLIGENNIFADTGDSVVDYRKLWVMPEM